MKNPRPCRAQVKVSVEQSVQFCFVQDCWLLGSDAIRVPNVPGAVSGPEDCSHLLTGNTVAIDERNPLTKYPDVEVAPQAAQRVVGADQSEATVVGNPAASGFPISWVFGSLDALDVPGCTQSLEGS